jgi:N-hydroxyarylamine O-acetyltransferase
MAVYGRTLISEYFARVGLVGELTPNLESLQRLVFAHVTTIPFENLDVLLDRTILVDEASVFEKLVRKRRGGYCYEHNRLMVTVLKELGFHARSLAGRVVWNKPKEQRSGRLHLFTAVTLDGEDYLVDVGVGNPTPTAPFKISAELQTTPHDQRRVVPDPEGRAGVFMHQVWWDSAWKDIYEFALDDCYMIDCEVGNFYVHKHPASWFRAKLMCTRARPDGTRIALVDTELTERRADSIIRTRTLTSGSELLAVLQSEFGLSFPEGTSFAATGAPVP